MAYKLRLFDVVEKQTGIKGQARFFNKKHCYDVMVKMNDGRHCIAHMDQLQLVFTYNFVEFVDAKAEKVLVDCGRLK